MDAKKTWLAIVGFCVTFASAVSSIYGQGWAKLPCETVNQSNVIFIGRVASLNLDANNKEPDHYLIEFIVLEPFIGGSTGEKLTARTNGGTADYVGIAVGKSFLIYAERVKDKPNLNLNSDSKAVNKAAADLLNLRMAGDDSSAKIFGSVRMFSKSSLYKDSQRPMPGVKVSIVSEENKFSLDTVTDPDGNFEVTGLLPGMYTVRPNLQQKKNLNINDSTYRLLKRGCSQSDVEVRYETQVSGKVVNAKGEPVAKARLELIPVEFQKPKYDVEEPNENAESDDSGNFSIANVPPGKYHLAVNYTFLPEKTSPYPTSFFPGTNIRAKAEVIVVTEDKNVDGLQYVLGADRLTEKKVTGRVVYADGSPVANTDVYLKEDENQTCCVLEKAVTDAKGNFVLIGFATHKYRIWTFVDHKPFTPKINYIGASTVFSLDNSTGAFQLVMKPTTKESLDAIDEIEMRDRGKIR